MPALLKSQIHSFLHDYKKRVFEIEHDTTRIAEREQRVTQTVKEILGEKSHFTFHQKVDPQAAQTLDLIYDFCHEAMLPPVVKRLADRIAVLEARHAAALELVTRVMESLADDSSVA